MTMNMSAKTDKIPIETGSTTKDSLSLTSGSSKRKNVAYFEVFKMKHFAEKLSFFISLSKSNLEKAQKFWQAMSD